MAKTKAAGGDAAQEFKTHCLYDELALLDVQSDNAIHEEHSGNCEKASDDSHTFLRLGRDHLQREDGQAPHSLENTSRLLAVGGSQNFISGPSTYSRRVHSKPREQTQGQPQERRQGRQLGRQPRVVYATRERAPCAGRVGSEVHSFRLSKSERAVSRKSPDHSCESTRARVFLGVDSGSYGLCAANHCEASA